MPATKKSGMICAAIALSLLAAVFSGCGKNAAPSQNPQSGGDSSRLAATDESADWDESTAVKIVLADGGATVSGNGATEKDGDIHITAGGDYAVSGKLDGGSVVIDTDGEVRLILNGAEITGADNPAVLVKNAGKLVLTLNAGTDNALSSDSDNGDNPDGALYCECGLTINGGGALSVNGKHNHGVVCGPLTVTGGKISVDAAEDGFSVSDSMRVKNAEFDITAGDDGKGITVSNDDETAEFYMESGRITVPSCNEGIEANKITVAGGDIDITAIDDGINANGSGQTSVIEIKGGNITVKNGNGRDADGLDSNGDIFITGGNVFVSLNGDGGNCAVDYGKENGGEFRIDGGTVLACGGNAMAEAIEEDSAQGFIMKTVTADAGAEVILKDGSGNTLLSRTVPYAFSLITVSVPNMKKGDRCVLSVGGSETEITVDNSSVAGGPGGGFHGGGGRRPNAPA